MLEENVLISFLRKFDENPFVVKVNGREYLIGEGEPAFTVKFQKSIPLSELIRSTSLALGEAYMDQELEIEGDLYEALDHFLGQMNKFFYRSKCAEKVDFHSGNKTKSGEGSA